MEFIIIGALIVGAIIIGVMISNAKKKEAEEEKLKQEKKVQVENSNEKKVASSDLFDNTSKPDNRIVGREIEDSSVEIKEKPIAWEVSSSYVEDAKEAETKVEVKAEEVKVASNIPSVVNQSTEEQAAHVFLVDDSFVVRKKVGDLLKKNNYVVTTKNDGFEAFGYLTGEGNPIPDLIITDIEMPNMTGVQLIEALRKEHKYQNTPIMVISAHVENHMVLMETGLIQGFISKPYVDDDLLNQLEYLINNN